MGEIKSGGFWSRTHNSSVGRYPAEDNTLCGQSARFAKSGQFLLFLWRMALVSWATMKTFLSFALCSLFAISCLKADVIAYWRFENNLNDSSGNSHNATGGTGFGYSSNVPGGTINPGALSNANSYIQGTGTTTVAAHIDLSNTFSYGNFTVEAFVYLNSGARNFNSLLANLNSGNSTGIYFSVGTSLSSDVAGYNGNGVLSDVTRGSGLSTNTWYHVAWVGTYQPNNGTALQFYVDGTAVGSAQFFARGTSGDTAVHINMGGDDWRIGGPSNNFNGLIDELRISNAALAPGQFLNAIPEPGTLTFLGTGLFLLFLSKRRGRSAA